MAFATIDVVLKRLAPLIEEKVRDEVCLLLNSKKEAENLCSKLKRIQGVLDNAEQRSVKDPKVQDWLERLQEAAYEMDDALDEWELKLHRFKMEESDQDVSEFWDKVSSFIQSLCLCFKDVLERRSVAWKIKELNGRLESIAKENEDEFKFLPNISSNSQPFERVRETSKLDLSKVHGREDVKNNLVNMLLSCGSQEKNDLEIISIMGVGGLGKTTLAKLAYNDLRVMDHFQTRIWFCVSNPFDETRIARAIIEAVEGNSPNLNELESLLERVKTCTSRKRFFLVLDDIWSDDEQKWTPLKESLKNGDPGSKILVTTRRHRVVEMMNATQFKSLHPLSDPDCWSLMSQIAFQGRRKEEPNRQEKIGKEIAKKCKGLPLAAVSLASLLQKKVTVREWEKVLESEIWALENSKVDLFPHMYLSYNELSAPVKRCFSYCAIFPKDFQIDVANLIRMWMAQGFLSSESGDEMELKGKEYFDELVASSFFQDLQENGYDGTIRHCKMHDIVHDFAQLLTKGECFIFENVDGREQNIINMSMKARHVNWLDTPTSWCNIEKLRTFLCKGELPPDVISNLKCVKALSIGEFYIGEPLSDIGNYLIHLRHLKLGGHNIRNLPRSLCDLHYLQTLDVVECINLKKLPEEIYKLKNLRHLLFWHNVVLPPGVGELKELRTLIRFTAMSKGSKLRFLKNLNQLEGSLQLELVDLNEESDVLEAQEAQLGKKIGLRSLVLRIKEKTRLDVIEALHPLPNLYHLSLRSFTQYPQWLGSLNNLKCLILVQCYPLPSSLWNLQLLEELIIRFQRSMECLVSQEFFGITDLINSVRTKTIGATVAFPQLRSLQFSYCHAWREWEDITLTQEEEENEFSFSSINIMPRLEELYIQDCPNLKSLPRRLLCSAPLKRLSVWGSDLLIEQYTSSKEEGGHNEFFIPTCQVVHQY